MLLKRRIVLFFSCLLIMLFPVSVFADGVGDGTPQDDQMVFSYWNIDYMYATRVNDNAVVLFEFPNDFFFRSMPTEETITLYGKTETGATVSSAFSLRFYGTQIDGIDYMYIKFVNTAGFKDFQFHFSNSVIHPTNSVEYMITSDPVISVPFFQVMADSSSDPVDVTLSAVQSFSSSYNYIVPDGQYDLSFNSSSGSVEGLSYSTIDGLNYYNLVMTRTQLNRIKGYFSNYGYASYVSIPYFDSVTTNLSLSDGYASADLYVYLPIGYCDSDNGYIAGGIRVSQWYDLFQSLRVKPDLPSPNGSTLPSDVAIGAAAFFGAVISGIFSIEMFPAIYIGGIVFCIFGIGFVYAFLKWFSGG